MKIAIPTRNQQVDEHFGHCDHYTIYSISDSLRIESEEVFQAPQGCGCKSNIAGILKEKGVGTMLAGNMGMGALQKIQQSGMKVVRGCEGNVRDIAELYLKGSLTDSGDTCNHHGEDGHQCEH
ncbi:MAG: NifB/NifX family molybdenum-iron cluster-binding protein [Bacteroidales bacterium]|nr:NifB/NifX family molybdenum-iron cluster-binding protein [Bacteroidales bacterium]